MSCSMIVPDKMIGSSPRVWGTFLSSGGTGFSSTVHPHVCGEHSRYGEYAYSTSRFIPTCVGNILKLMKSLESARFIPTCVGNMKLNELEKRGGSVHPHVCGEHLTTSCKFHQPCRFIPTCVGNIQNISRPARNLTGSSPRVWGTYPPSNWISRKTTVHPHVCGEHGRGARQTVTVYRFIPTCVGNIYRIHF